MVAREFNGSSRSFRRWCGGGVFGNLFGGVFEVIETGTARRDQLVVSGLLGRATFHNGSLTPAGARVRRGERATADSIRQIFDSDIEMGEEAQSIVVFGADAFEEQPGSNRVSYGNWRLEIEIDQSPSLISLFFSARYTSCGSRHRQAGAEAVSLPAHQTSTPVAAALIAAEQLGIPATDAS